MAPTTRSLAQRGSPFLDPGPVTKANSLALLHLSRDNLEPVYLAQTAGEHDGYAEGVVVNTRYGSYPHSSMIGIPWGTQIRASKVDTGSRGRKRKRPNGDDAGPSSDGTPADTPAETETPEPPQNPAKQPVATTSGFIHILPPTPELWTLSLPHRTQVVYTPDYSYILHRIRARPGTVLIEAGAGSGSFSHASVRAVYNGYPDRDGKHKGKVFSYEFHEDRYRKMKKEIQDHGLEGLVQLTHRDVYNGGFLVDGESPKASSIFLDLPSPWEALPHLSRQRPQSDKAENGSETTEEDEKPWVSPLDPKKNAYLCTFSPCIEQVTRTVSALRRLGWVDIDMLEIAHRKLHTVRDRVGLNLPYDRSVNVSAKDVDEALGRLTEIEDRLRENSRPRAGADAMDDDDDIEADDNNITAPASTAEASSARPWKDGRLVTRGEPEIKSHTSYLVFAILPREWTGEQEAAALAKYPVGETGHIVGALDKAARKKERREHLESLKNQGSRKARRNEGFERLAKISETAV
ncbi:S-adenosyl-L-methionine-dependent methyltransferase [Rhypophila decipiens]|uniref:tRNA (adenine(58)-N(1))-methyltransferase catalytic subunit TRM61 n=1 Tax=Rhypophila decipiens TaxID=261697 RepID=A0AAN7BCX9_9PEZI|nr:S-adenosyl-L-methionine-dependent methyltransferase [Rhypophila decipiens]